MLPLGEEFMKKFRIEGKDIQEVTSFKGACYASDRITVDGHFVGYAYREASDVENDSGWRFLAGDENDSYMNNSLNFNIYDLNTIANYDRKILKIIGSPIGSAFVRVQDGDFKLL
jgi:hypothetical protein